MNLGVVESDPMRDSLGEGFGLAVWRHTAQDGCPVERESSTKVARKATWTCVLVKGLSIVLGDRPHSGPCIMPWGNYNVLKMDH